MSTAADPINLADVNARLSDASAEQIIQWALDAFGDRLVMTSSFGAQSAVMLHLASRVAPNLPVILIDTGYLFPETYRFIDELAERFALNLHVVAPKITAARLEATRGKLWAQGREGHDRYNQLVKVEPMQRALDDLHAAAWLAGLRAEQTAHRANLQLVEQQDGIYKIHPILRWSRRDVGQYMIDHDLPYHPLVERGYASIGDTHSTRPITGGESEREGRFHGFAEECGLHIPQNLGENESLESSGL